uniref:RRP15-like protein n=1 Tax=Setaria digitata TaxID=48799 RepID=A0A915PXW8_9BILA
MDQLEVEEVCSTSSENLSYSSSDEDSLTKQKQLDDQQTVIFDDGIVKQPKEKLKRSKRELRAEHLAKYKQDRMGMVLPDVVRDRERERIFVNLATKGVVQLFNAVAERQKKLSDTSATTITSKKRRLQNISAENFNKRLVGSKTFKDEADDTKEDWLSKNAVGMKSETEDDLDTSEIKTEPESDSDSD